MIAFGLLGLTPPEAISIAAPIVAAASVAAGLAIVAAVARRAKPGR